MTHDSLSDLINYHYWARDCVLDAAESLTAEQFTRSMGSSFTSVRDTIAHLCSAESIWIHRLNGTSFDGNVTASRITNVDVARMEWAGLEREMRDELVALGMRSTTTVVRYQDLKGNDQADPVWQILQHLVNHGSYHRGQITTMLRQLGAVPPRSMDLIAFYRERAG